MPKRFPSPQKSDLTKNKNFMKLMNNKIRRKIIIAKIGVDRSFNTKLETKGKQNAKIRIFQVNNAL